MRDYFTIIRDYFYDYFSDFSSFAIIQVIRLYAIIFPIIYDDFMASAHGKWECLLICIDSDCQWKARRQNGKLPDGPGAFPVHYYTH
jgi:hypothetical protein